MARGRAGKGNPRGAVRNGRRSRPKTAASDAPPCEAPLVERLAAVERERDALRAALELERTRRRALEKVHAATRERIAWALDSLESILNAKT